MHAAGRADIHQIEIAPSSQLLPDLLAPRILCGARQPGGCQAFLPQIDAILVFIAKSSDLDALYEPEPAHGSKSAAADADQTDADGFKFGRRVPAHVENLLMRFFR
ncbi:MAG: hypothetical protein BWY83_01584 [bacterium ADurb.Bin478]|nr:MAG: hypothetical protein BWY83_01584 [bacterium ADurb.Bin478]